MAVVEAAIQQILLEQAYPYALFFLLSAVDVVLISALCGCGCCLAVDLGFPTSSPPAHVFCIAFLSFCIL